MIGLKLFRAVIDKVEGRLFSAQGFIGQELKGELWQHYGFTSRPLKGAKGIALTLPNGSFLISTVDENRLIEIDEGEVCIHATPNVKIHLKSDDSIEITAEKVMVKSENIELGAGTLEKMIKGETFMELFNKHSHLDDETPPTTPMTEELHLSKEVKNA
jgi:hypothetical protein